MINIIHNVYQIILIGLKAKEREAQLPLQTFFIDEAIYNICFLKMCLNCKNFIFPFTILCKLNFVIRKQVWLQIAIYWHEFLSSLWIVEPIITCTICMPQTKAINPLTHVPRSVCSFIPAVSLSNIHACIQRVPGN